jgi:hypothetical protein
MSRSDTSPCGTPSRASSDKRACQVRVHPRPPHHHHRQQLLAWVGSVAVPGLYQGFMPNFIGSAIAWGQYFYLYQRFKELMRGSRTSRRELGPGQHLAAGFSAGAVTATCTNPIWVVKTRMQTQMRGTQGNYRGLLRTCARSVPALLTCAAHRTRTHTTTTHDTTRRNHGAVERGRHTGVLSGLGTVNPPSSCQACLCALTGLGSGVRCQRCSGCRTARCSSWRTRRSGSC